MAAAAVGFGPSVFPGYTPGQGGPALYAAAAVIAASPVLAAAAVVGHTAVLAAPPLGDVLGIAEAAAFDVGAPAAVVSKVVEQEIIAHH